MKRVWHAIVLAAFNGFIAAAKVIPLRFMLWYASMMGTLGFLFVRRYRDVAYKNLGIAYGDSLSHAEKMGIVKRVFQNFAKSALAEFPKAAGMPNEAIKKLCYLDPVMYQSMRSTLESGRGLIALSGHFGNFELCARRFAAEGQRFGVVARIDANSALTGLFNQIRNRGGYDVIGRGDAARPLIKRLREPGVVALLPDQKSEDVFVPFYGTLVGSVAGPAILALRTGARILPVFCVRQPDDTHKIVSFDDIDTTATGDTAADVERIMTDYSLTLEKVVRAYPDQWLWLHDRWRSRPSPEVQARWEQSQIGQSVGC